jgi:hypothetical protein
MEGRLISLKDFGRAQPGDALFFCYPQKNISPKKRIEYLRALRPLLGAAPVT